MKLYLPKRVDEPKFDCGWSLLETIWDVLCDGDVLLHIQGQQIDLSVKACCDVFHQKMHVVSGKVVENDGNRPRILEVHIATLMSRSPVRS